MTPRETNNKPPEDNQPTATQREWERLWEQGDEGGGRAAKR